MGRRAIKVELRLSMQNSWKWWDRFRVGGVAGLKDKTWQGRPLVYMAADENHRFMLWIGPSRCCRYAAASRLLGHKPANL